MTNNDIIYLLKIVLLELTALGSELAYGNQLQFISMQSKDDDDAIDMIEEASEWNKREQQLITESIENLEKERKIKL